MYVLNQSSEELGGASKHSHMYQYIYVVARPGLKKPYNTCVCQDVPVSYPPTSNTHSLEDEENQHGHTRKGYSWCAG